MSRVVKAMIHKATIETPNHPSGAEMVTVSGTGPEVFSLAYSAYQIGAENGVSVKLHFYLNDREVHWPDVVAAMDPRVSVENALREAFKRAGLEEMPF